MAPYLIWFADDEMVARCSLAELFANLDLATEFPSVRAQLFEMNALALQHHLSTKLKSIPVIFTTTEADEQERETAKQKLGAAGPQCHPTGDEAPWVLVKPYWFGRRIAIIESSHADHEQVSAVSE